MTAFCRDCLADTGEAVARCSVCGSSRILNHPELFDLSIAHIDCDAFYAAIEMRDDPSLRDKPVIIGGGKRGVVSTASYEARKFGVRSAMPMFQALKLCPKAIVIGPNMRKYADVSRAIRGKFEAVTPLVEPLSLDEAYLDLSGTARLHGMAPAKTLARLSLAIEKDIGITVSVGLSYNKFLAKLASDLMKPRGFAVIGRAEAISFLKDKPVSMIRGVGPRLAAELAKDGIDRIGQIQDTNLKVLAHRHGEVALWLHRLSRGEDKRRVDPEGETKSVSAETTFENNIAARAELETILWELSERVSARAKAAGIGGRTVTLKLKTAAFKLLTRSTSLENPTQLSDTIYRIGRTMLEREARGTSYRLIGIGLSQLCDAITCDPPDLLDGKATRRAAVERAMDDVRQKFGRSAVRKGRGFGQR
jgi:DNA polymerase-4